MSKECEECGKEITSPEQILSSHEAWGRVLCMDCQIKANEQLHDEVVDDSSVWEEVEPEGWKQLEAIPTNTAIEYSNDIVRPAISAMEAKAAWQEYINMRKVILEPTDFQRIQGKDFIKKSGWRKFATFYNLTDAIVEENRIKVNDGEFIWKIKVNCTAPNGRVTEGVAMCSSKEKTGARIEHDVYSTAHTRAKNRAISDMIAAGEVSAEEMMI